MVRNVVHQSVEWATNGDNKTLVNQSLRIYMCYTTKHKSRQNITNTFGLTIDFMAF